MPAELGLPQATEYADYYADYVGRVPETDIFGVLEKQLADYQQVLNRIGDSEANERTDGKWSLKEVLGHLCDAERVFSYRALRFSRGDQNPLHSFEQDDYVREGDAQRRTVADLFEEFTHLRRATIVGFRNLTPEMAMRTGVASGKEVSVRALLYIAAGHARRHLEIIRERYAKL